MTSLLCRNCVNVNDASRRLHHDRQNFTKGPRAWQSICLKTIYLSYVSYCRSKPALPGTTNADFWQHSLIEPAPLITNKVRMAYLAVIEVTVNVVAPLHAELLADVWGLSSLSGRFLIIRHWRCNPAVGSSGEPTTATGRLVRRCGWTGSATTRFITDTTTNVNR